MFKRLVEWIRPSAPKTSEDLEAQAEAEQMRQQRETQRMGALEGPAMYTHGGRESRGD
jgi:hypothetical protein